MHMPDNQHIFCHSNSTFAHTGKTGAQTGRS